jgi:hypothetical protein
VLGIVWLPTAILGAASYVLLRPFYTDIFSGNNGAVMVFDPRLMRIDLMLQLLLLLMTTILSVGITKEILGTRTGPRSFYLRFGAAKFRVLIGYFALILLFIVFSFAFVLAGSIAGGVIAAVVAMAVPSFPDALGWTVGVTVLAVFLAIIFIMVRLSFLFGPATVAELGPLVIIFCAIDAVLGVGYFDFATHHLKDPAAVQAHIMQRMQRIMPILGNPVAVVLGWLVYPVFYGLTLSPPVFAYRALIPPPRAAGANR